MCATPDLTSAAVKLGGMGKSRAVLLTPFDLVHHTFWSKIIQTMGFYWHCMRGVQACPAAQPQCSVGRNVDIWKAQKPTCTSVSPKLGNEATDSPRTTLALFCSKRMLCRSELDIN